MTPAQWRTVKHFHEGEKWGDPGAMDYGLLRELDALRSYVGLRVVIHCGYEPRDGKGFHPLGQAADLHIEGLDLMGAFIAASRFNFRGIGVYPWWNSPGLHLDMRPLKRGEPRALWGSAAPRDYYPFDSEFIAHVLRGAGKPTLEGTPIN